jgi:hypothetical protein
LRIRTEFKNPPQPSNPNPKTFPREEQGELGEQQQQQKLAHEEEEEEEAQERAATVRDVDLRLQGIKGAPHCCCCWFEKKKTDLKPLQSVELLKCNKRAPGNPALRNNISRYSSNSCCSSSSATNAVLLPSSLSHKRAHKTHKSLSLVLSLSLSLSLRGAVLSLVSPTGYRTDKVLTQPGSYRSTGQGEPVPLKNNNNKINCICP